MLAAAFGFALFFALMWFLGRRVGSPDPVQEGEPVLVTRVLDGDTFAVGARRIRVLGIDAAETGERLGPAATQEARRLLCGWVYLIRQPGVDRDRYERELRYVRLADGSDFGERMVTQPHTTVYAGRNDASAARARRLWALDRAGR